MLSRTSDAKLRTSDAKLRTSDAKLRTAARRHHIRRLI